MRGLFGTLAGGPKAADAETILRSLYVRPAKSGENVTAKTALQVPTVLACVRLLAWGVAQVELQIMKRRSDGGADPATDHPLYWPLYQQPNAWQTSFRFRETLMAHLVLCGNAFVFKNRVRGRIVELIPFEPGQVIVERRADWSLVYKVRSETGVVQEFPQEAIWHLRGPSWNSWMGLEAVALAREAIGLAMAAETTQAKLHKNSLRASGLYSVDGNLTDAQYKMLRAWIDDYLNAEEMFKPLILDRAAKFTPTAMSGVDSQHIETRRHQIEQICQAFGVLPVMIGHPADMAARAAVEQITIMHSVNCIGPWYKRLEEDINVGLLDPADRRTHFADFDERGLMRAALKDQAEYYSKALGSGGAPGWLTQNDVRREVGYNPLPEGDALPKPTNPAVPATEGSES